MQSAKGLTGFSPETIPRYKKLMDIILLCLGIWCLGGLLGLRKRRPVRKRKSGRWKPPLDAYDYEEHLRRNGK